MRYEGCSEYRSVQTRQRLEVTVEEFVQPSFRILLQCSVLSVEKREHGPAIQYYVGQPIAERQQL